MINDLFIVAYAPRTMIRNGREGSVASDLAWSPPKVGQIRRYPSEVCPQGQTNVPE